MTTLETGRTSGEAEGERPSAKPGEEVALSEALEVAGAHSATVFTDPEQEFYIQLSEQQRFGIAKLTPKGNVRIVENITVMPVSNEMVEEPVMVEIFRKQLTNDGMLYKIWPKQAMEPGEYAVIEYTDGKMNMQVWDFAIQRGK